MTAYLLSRLDLVAIAFLLGASSFLGLAFVGRLIGWAPVNLTVNVKVRDD